MPNAATAEAMAWWTCAALGSSDRWSADANSAAAERQQTMAVSVLACERVLAALDGRPAGWLEEQSRQALAQAPDAAQWARSFTRDLPISPKAFRRRAAPATVHAAVQGVAL